MGHSFIHVFIPSGLPREDETNSLPFGACPFEKEMDKL